MNEPFRKVIGRFTSLKYCHATNISSTNNEIAIAIKIFSVSDLSVNKTAGKNKNIL